MMNIALDDPHIARLAGDGTLGTTFDTSGYMTSRTIGLQEDFRKVFPDGAGGIFNALTSGNGTNKDILVRHLLANGALDTAYGTNGNAIFDSGDTDEVTRAFDASLDRMLIAERAGTEAIVLRAVK